MFRFISLGVSVLFVLGGALSVGARPCFDRQKDILIAQFDLRPDPDDFHSVAALGCILSHADFSGIECYAVQGAYGVQETRFYPAYSLFNLAFGEEGERWTDAHREREESIRRIAERVRNVLDEGGQVWVQESGQSDLTADWIKALLEDGVPAKVLRSRLIVVQHSWWNEKYCTPEALTFVKKNSYYWHIDDGNTTRDTSTGPLTPSYKAYEKLWLERALQSGRSQSRRLWAEADRLIKESKNFPEHSCISTGGVDFSDCVETWWILDLQNADSVEAFWGQYVESGNPLLAQGE